MKLLEVGTRAPDFESKDHNGASFRLSDLKGKKVILYFYPKDFTPGCTKEAQNLRDAYKELQEKGFEIIGVSPDSVESHKKFVEKHQLPFRLIADEEKKIVRLYGVWGEKKRFGKTYEGVHRITYLIDEEGIIRGVIKKVKPSEHAQQILAAWDKILQDGKK